MVRTQHPTKTCRASPPPLLRSGTTTTRRADNAARRMHPKTAQSGDNGPIRRQRWQRWRWRKQLRSGSVRPSRAERRCLRPVLLRRFAAFSPYRGLTFPPSLVECGAIHSSALRRRVPRPPRTSPRGTTAGLKDRDRRRRREDPSAWHGADLTDAARAQYRSFVNKLRYFLPHASYPVSLDEISAAVAVPPRRLLPRPDDCGRRR